jgi:hypothetical protein
MAFSDSMMDLRSEHDTAALIQQIKDSPNFHAKSMAFLVWTVHQFLNEQESGLPELTEGEVHDTLAQFPGNGYTILGSELVGEAHDLRRKGVSYSAIARIMEDKPNGPDEISRETIRRYCDEAEIES